jgi:chromosome segregation ATPase
MRRASIEAQCQELAAAGEQLDEVRGQLTALSAGAARLAEQEHRARKLVAEVEAAQQRRSELEAREATLRAEAEHLATTINTHQDALAQIRQHAARQAELGRAIETARQELADLTARLTPMRDWKEAMDLLYARFADLPQSSTEAQEVWREIEAGKAALRRHIIASQTRAPRIMHIEFARSTKPGTPMKSERVRGKDQA